MAVIAFALGWISGRWHQAKRSLVTKEEEVLDLEFEEGNQTEWKELEVAPPCMVRNDLRNETSKVDVEETLFVSRKGTKVH